MSQAHDCQAYIASESRFCGKPARFEVNTDGGDFGAGAKSRTAPTTHAASVPSTTTSGALSKPS
jgi:hypothetical protein